MSSGLLLLKSSATFHHIRPELYILSVNQLNVLLFFWDEAFSNIDSLDVNNLDFEWKNPNLKKNLNLKRK